MAQSAPSRLVKDLDRMVKPYGWTWERSSGNHLKYRGPDGKGLVVVPCSRVSDPRTIKNIIRDFRREGCPV